MQRAVVAIGIRKTGGLPELEAAQQSAAAVADWARGPQKIPASRVKLITDARGRVGRDRIFETIHKITELGYVQQLIVYFSGHGVNSGLHEQWLLSRAPNDPVAAVNVRGSELLARFCGISHVVFISDACRTAADSIQAQAVTGGEIFPNPNSRGAENPVDQYFATLVGNPAFEVKTVADAVSRYRAAYSTVLLEALSGKVPSLIESTATQRVIRPRPLKRHLAIAVPDYVASLKLPGGETQQPDARIESEAEAWVAEFPLVATPTSPASMAKRGGRGRPTRSPGLTGDEDLPPPGVIGAGKRTRDLATEARDDLIAALDPAAAPSKRRAKSPVGGERGSNAARAALDRAVSIGTSPFGPDHFETECGIKVRGASLTEAYAKHAGVVVGQRRDVVQVNLNGNRRGASVIVKLVDGSAAVVPAFRDYITGLTFDAEGNLDDVWCEPSANTVRWQEWQRAAKEIRELRTVMAAASSLGVFRLDEPVHSEVLLRRLQGIHSIDPAMAVYAAYALHDQRMRPQIASMQQALDRSLSARIFDVAMLAFAIGKTPVSGEPREMYPFVPLLTQGWALLDATRTRLKGHLAALRGQLRSSLWTHFRPAATDVLIDTLRNGEVE